MLRKHSIATALGFLSLLGAVELANARIFVTTFAGTRGQVAGACNGPGRDLYEGTDSRGIGFSWCVDNVRNTSVVCGDEGSCVGSSGDAPPDRPKGPKGKGIRGDGRMAAPAESLSEPGDSSPVEPVATPVQPDVVIIN